MRNSADPTVHKEREKRFIEHVERLLADERLRVDTADGRRPVAQLRRVVSREDGEVDLKRLMSELEIYDRELQGRMPVGVVLEATLTRTRMLFFQKTVGRLVAACLSPREALLEGREAPPITAGEVTAALERHAGEGRGGPGPATVVLASTSGFTQDAKGLVGRTAKRTVILAEPNSAGGWTIWAPPELSGLAELLDPEAEAEKRQRVREAVEARRTDLLTGALSAERIARATELPAQLVGDELQCYAKEHPGLSARRIEGGDVVLYREGGPTLAGAGDDGGSDMPFIQRIKEFFGGKENLEKRMSELSMTQAKLQVLSDRQYEELEALEKKEADLREQFKATTSDLSKRRLVGQMTQLRKEIGNKQQMVNLIKQQLHVVGTDLHNMLLLKQGKAAALPSSQDLTEHSEKAQELIAGLQVDAELADSLGPSGTLGMSEEEQALFEELEREQAAERQARGEASGAGAANAGPAEKRETPPRRTPAEASSSSSEVELPAELEDVPPLPDRRERGQAEAG